MPARPALSLLIIDDNPGSLEMLSSALAQPDLEILTASDPELGVDLVHSRHPQIILTDLVLLPELWATGYFAFDDYAATVSSAGAAAKLIVLDVLPLGLDPAAFDPGDDGSPVNLVAMLDSGCATNTASFGTFTDTLYAIVAKRLVCGVAPASAVDTVRAAQQSDPCASGIGGVNVKPQIVVLANRSDFRQFVERTRGRCAQSCDHLKPR
jgi:hypothetical protein